jgi:AcrR family transcriptional regulator
VDRAENVARCPLFSLAYIDNEGPVRKLFTHDGRIYLVDPALDLAENLGSGRAHRFENSLKALGNQYFSEYSHADHGPRTRSSSGEIVGMPAEKKSSTPKGRGPRDERGVTLAQIERVARKSFAENGWAGTSLRGIAREVGVDPALVHYYFSSKQALLDAVTMPPAEWLASIQATNAVPLHDRGEAIVRNVVWAWSQPQIRELLTSILLTAAHEPRTREKLRVFITASLLPAVADRLEDEERSLRASLIATQVLGLAMLRYVWQIEPLASLSDEDLVKRVAPTIQRYLTGRLA